MYRDTVTVFIRQVDKTGDIWHPIIIEGVDLNEDRARVVETYGEGSADRAILHIKCNEGLIADRIYMQPKEWDASDHTGITFHVGENFDFFYAGEYADGAVIADEDYNRGFYDYMNRNYDRVYAITQVARYSVIPHFEIAGK